MERPQHFFLPSRTNYGSGAPLLGNVKRQCRLYVVVGDSYDGSPDGNGEGCDPTGLRDLVAETTAASPEPFNP